MDISKFNKVLSEQINKAKISERQGNIERAIDIWLKISELTLKASKVANLDFSYRNMLIKKTEQIINHVKELKEPKPKEKPEFKESQEAQKASISEVEDIDLPEIPQQKPKELGDVKERPRRKGDNKKGKTIDGESNPKIENIDEDSSKDQSISGLKEIKASKDFKIITPHDPDYVKKRMEEADEIESHGTQNNVKFTHQEKKKDNIIEMETKSESGELICFACGAENPPTAQKCVDCGTELK